MMKALMLLVVLGVAGLSAQTKSDEALIRDSRAQSNAAIARHDAPGIAGFWMDDIHITTSTSAQATGIATNRDRMSQQFNRRPDTVYVRTPSTIDVFAAWAVASERGEWVGRWTEPDGAMEIRGTYLAQWRKVDGRWLIQSELYVPTQCKGSKYCSQRP
ncbi:MAG: nuclear transport factor 2 family protein [Cyanobacteria bacterium]|nr:nuclear transport factor 2 family protein [Cyanobacteriota bacterium]